MFHYMIVHIKSVTLNPRLPEVFPVGFWCVLVYLVPIPLVPLIT